MLTFVLLSTQAARLSENPDVTVGIIEAGANRMDDPQVYTPSLYPTLIGREKYDCQSNLGRNFL